jgi:hypothetical protein
MKQGACFLDVGRDCDEVLGDEIGEFRVVVGFGLQPNATTSGGCSAEVDEQGLVLGFRAGERAVQIFGPFQWHEFLP